MRNRLSCIQFQIHKITEFIVVNPKNIQFHQLKLLKIQQRFMLSAVSIGMENRKLDYIDFIPKCRGNGLKRVYLPMNTENTIDSLSNYLMPFLDETG